MSSSNSENISDSIQCEVEARHHEAPWFISPSEGKTILTSPSEFYLEKIIEARKALNQPLSSRFISEVRESIR